MRAPAIADTANAPDNTDPAANEAQQALLAERAARSQAAQRAARREAAQRAAKQAGGVIAAGAKWIGGQVKQGVAFVDPDARRTLLEAPLLGLTQFGSRRTRIRPLADDGHPPLIFLHGLGAHPGNFRPMRAALALRGRRRTYSVGFGPHTSTLEMAQQVREAIADIATVNDLSADAQVDIVAHSMGGLVARAALLDPATATRVRTVITLGTPHAGTHLARLAASRKLLDLRPDSDVVEAIAAQLPWPGRPSMPRLVALWSDADVLVQPHQSAAVEGAENVPLSGVTHLGYLLDPAMWRLVGDALAKSDAEA